MGKRSLHEQYTDLHALWCHSEAEQQLIRFLHDSILSSSSLSLSSALCLGLGSFRDQKRFNVLHNPTSSPRLSPLPEDPLLWEDVATYFEDEDDTPIRPVFTNEATNIPLYQLLIFETILTTLREQLVVPTVRFQDPAFTEEDTAFLEGRGYEVLRYPLDLLKTPQGQPSLDPAILELADSTTFFLAPRLDQPVAVGVICAANPALYMGNDALKDASYPFTVMKYKSKLEEYVFSHRWKKMEALGFGADFGIMWEADLSDEVVLRAQERRMRRMEVLDGHFREVKEEVRKQKQKEKKAEDVSDKETL